MLGFISLGVYVRRGNKREMDSAGPNIKGI